MTEHNPATPEPESSDDASIEGRIDEALQMLDDGAPFDVKVSGHWKNIKPHPLAMAYPVLPREEFVGLVADVAAHGFREPVHLIPDTGYGASKTAEMDVLEGRHRVAVAWVLRLSLNNTVRFDGTDQEAVALVDSYNLHRRHLSTAFRTLRVAQRIWPEEKAKAEERRLAGNSAGGKGGKSTAESPEDLRSTSTKMSAAQAAAIRAGGSVTARNIELMAPVLHAPETQRRIASGEITTVAAARREAEAEIAAMPKTRRPKGYQGKTPPGTNPAGPSVAASVTQLVKHAENLRKAIANDRWGKITADELVEALTDVRGVLADCEENPA
jgi:hypothetical protein